MNPPGVIRVRPAPAWEGPYDDEPGLSPPRTDGALALALPGLDPARPPVPLRLVPPARPDVGTGPPPPLRPLLPRLAQAVAEVLAGSRNPAQLAGYTTYEVLCQLERWSGRLGQREGGPTLMPRVTSIHVNEPAARVVETCLVVDTGRRRRAIALRLEAPGQSWRCTALQIG